MVSPWFTSHPPASGRRERPRGRAGAERHGGFEPGGMGSPGDDHSLDMFRSHIHIGDVCIYIYMYIHIELHIYIYMYVCIYIYV